MREGWRFDYLELGGEERKESSTGRSSPETGSGDSHGVFTPSDDAIILSMKAAGETWASIGAAIGRRSKKEVRLRWKKLSSTIGNGDRAISRADAAATIEASTNGGDADTGTQENPSTTYAAETSAEADEAAGEAKDECFVAPPASTTATDASGVASFMAITTSRESEGGVVVIDPGSAISSADAALMSGALLLMSAPAVAAGKTVAVTDADRVTTLSGSSSSSSSTSTSSSSHSAFAVPVPPVPYEIYSSFLQAETQIRRVRPAPAHVPQ